MLKPKRLLINIHYLEIGGAETSLLGLLHALDPKEIDVDLLINNPHGELMKYIPTWVNIIKSPKSYNYIERPLVETVRDGQLGVVYGRLKAKICYKFSGSRGDAIFGYVGKYVTPFLPSLKKLGTYDVALSYLAPHNIVLKKITAKKKICWIHTDYSKIEINRKLEIPVWSGYDRIVSISPEVTKSFLQIFPTLKDKIVEIENFLPIELIKNKADEFLPEDMTKEEGIINLLTIGRYCEAKRIDEIPQMARILKHNGIKFKWFIIGYGSEQELNKIKNQISINNVDEEVVLLGKKVNPYPYIKSCDAYIQPSRYEGKSITVREAQLLGKPVVITNYPTASSQLKDGVDGCIGPYDTVAFSDFLKMLIKDSEKLNKIKRTLNQKVYSQNEYLREFISLFKNDNEI